MIGQFTSGRNIEERWNKLKETEKELWRKQVQLGVSRHLSHLRELSTTAIFRKHGILNEGPTNSSDQTSSNETFLNQLEIDLADDESQYVELKREFPDSSKELGNNIASFATSNTGRIYIGIDKSGTLSPSDPLKGKGKDEARRRITGIVKSVSPTITLEINFIEKDSKNIIRIDVPKGSAPVYLCDNIPYVRDNSESRRANHDEINQFYEKYYTYKERQEEKKIPILRYGGIRRDSTDKYFLKIEKVGEGQAKECYGSLDIDGYEVLHNFPLTIPKQFLFSP